MSILGLGTDIVSILRIADLLQKHGDRFLKRCFLPGEIAWAQSRGLGMTASLAGRWAAKEAFLKALGRSVGHIPYGDIEVERSSEGPISLRLHGRAAEALQQLGAVTCLVTISHEREFATATVVIQ